MADGKVRAMAITLPAGALLPIDTLDDNEYDITIVALLDNNEMIVRYPKGYERTHQATTIEELVTKIISNLRSRYGVGPIKVLQICPLEKDGVIKMEIRNGDAAIP